MYKIPAHTLFLGKSIQYMQSCHSTNDIAKLALQNHDISEGFLFITDEQTQGRGQRGNSWFSEAGKNLTCSIVLCPKFLPLHEQFYLNMISSLAVQKTFEDQGVENVKVKWPNDVLISQKKAAGILIENSVKNNKLEWTVLGVGVNINQMRFHLERATSLWKETGTETSVEEYLHQFLAHLEALYLRLRDGKKSDLKELYLSNLFGYQQIRQYRSEYEFEGKLVDVTDAGFLVIETGGRLQQFDFKEVEFIWPSL